MSVYWYIFFPLCISLKWLNWWHEPLKSDSQGNGCLWIKLRRKFLWSSCMQSVLEWSGLSYCSFACPGNKGRIALIQSWHRNCGKKTNTWIFLKAFWRAGDCWGDKGQIMYCSCSTWALPESLPNCSSV